VHQKKILIIRFSALGDVVLALRSLRGVDSSALEIHFLTKKKFGGIVAKSNWVQRVHTISDRASLSELNRQMQGLKKENFDAVVDLHSVMRSRAACALLGIKTFRAHKPRIIEWVLFLLKQWPFKKIGLRPLDRVALFDRTLDRTLNFLNLSRVRNKEECDFGGLEDIKKKHVAIAADSAWSQKEWPIERFANLALRLVERGESVVWLGFKKLPRSIPGVSDLSGTTRLEDLPKILAESKILLCNDAGLMHLAESVGTPVVAVFGPTVPQLGFQPHRLESRVLESTLWCRPCSKSGRWCFRPLEPQLCLKLVSEDRVWQALSAILRDTKQNSNEASQSI